MRTPANPSPTLAEVDQYISEGISLIAQAEERLRQLERDRACQGHLLMGAQILTAMRRNLRLLQERRDSLEKEAAALPVVPPVREKQHWWRSFLSYRGTQPSYPAGGRSL